MKHFMLTMMATVVAVCAMAQANYVYIEDFEIAPGETLEVPLLLTNADETRGVQFNITLPDGLQLEDYELTKYARSRKMNTFGNDKGNYWCLGMYPSQSVCFEPQEKAAIMTLYLTAGNDFKGGEILLWKQRGSTMDSKAIKFDDHTTTVKAVVSAVQP